MSEHKQGIRARLRAARAEFIGHCAQCGRVSETCICRRCEKSAPLKYRLPWCDRRWKGEYLAVTSGPERLLQPTAPDLRA